MAMKLVAFEGKRIVPKRQTRPIEIYYFLHINDNVDEWENYGRACTRESAQVAITKRFVANGARKAYIYEEGVLTFIATKRYRTIKIEPR